MDDYNLTTEDAITVLRNLQDWLYFSAMNGGTSIQREAIDIAIGALQQPEIIFCKDCKHNPNLSWIGCPMSHLSEAQRPETAWCWKAERREATNEQVNRRRQIENSP